MARKRHLASSARGFCGFCLAPSIHQQIRLIRPIRGRNKSTADRGEGDDGWLIGPHVLS